MKISVLVEQLTESRYSESLTTDVGHRQKEIHGRIVKGKKILLIGQEKTIYKQIKCGIKEMDCNAFNLERSNVCY